MAVGEDDAIPVVRTATPIPTTSPSRIREPVDRADAVAGWRVSWRRPRYASAPETARTGSSPKKIRRQLKASATTPAIAGPKIPGRIHAVDIVANIRGRRCSGRLRPIAT